MIFSQVEQLIKMTKDLSSKWPMVLSQVEHLVKMAMILSKKMIDGL
jgi:hypothetical protein